MLILIAFAAVSFSALAIGFIMRNAAADNAVVSVETLKTSYDRGETLVIPENVGIEYNGKTVAADSCHLVAPDGKTLSGKTFELSATGRYTLVLEATSEGKRVSASKTFTVNDNLYHLDNEESYVEFGNLNSAFAYGGMNKGLSLHLTDGATFTYKQPINVYDQALTDILRFNLMRCDNFVEYLTVRFTDCYDPSIAIDVIYWKVSMEEYVAMTAGQAGYSAIGLNEARASRGETGKYVIDGKQYNVGIFGTEIDANRNSVNHNINNITVSFDTSDRQAIKIYGSTDTEVHTKLIAELNNDKLFAYKFPGFTNGNVFLSITASGFKNVKYADIEIGEIMGARNEELNRMGKYIDAEPPIITIEGSEEDNRVYTGLYANVPKAIARDASGIAKDIDYTVWHNYFGYPKTAVSVTDGKFLPRNDGEYTVVYTATDRYGNEAEKLFTLRTVGKKSEGISIQAENVGEIFAGETADLLNYTVDSLCGSPKVKVTLVYPDKTEKEVTANALLIEKTGEYTVKYEFEDAYYAGSKEYKFVAKSSGKPAFESAFIPVPARFIKNADYSAERPAAYVYTENGRTASEVKAYVSFDGGEYKEFDASDFTVIASETVKIKYVCEADPTVFIESAEVPVVDVGYGTKQLTVSKYFYGDFDGESDLTKTVYTANKAGKARLGFTGKILLSAFVFDFNVAAEKDISSLEIVFTDYYDETKTASLKLFGDNGAFGYSVNGNRGELITPWKGERIKVGAADGGVRIGSATINADFGFTSDLCLVDFVFDGVAEGFSFELYTFCNQSFKRGNRDVIAPMISAAEPDKIMNLGESYYTAIPCVADVLSPSPFKNCTLSVYRDGKIFVGENGVKFEKLSADRSYEFKFTAYGTYLFVYEYSDGAGYPVDVRFNVQVIDDVAPSAEFKNAPAGTVKVKVGTLVTPLEVIVSDNETAEADISVWAIVYDADGRLIAYVEKTAHSSKYVFTLTEKGKYTVYIYCTDETGNSASLVYELEAE